MSATLGRAFLHNFLGQAPAWYKYTIVVFLLINPLVAWTLGEATAGWLLLAEFIAAVQILVYIGAVGILLLFAIMLTERVTGDDERRVTSRGWFWGFVVAAAVFIILLLPVIQQLPSPEAAQTIEPSVKELGHKLMNPYVVTLEVLALLLTAALIGAVTAAQGVRMPKEENSPE